MKAHSLSFPMKLTSQRVILVVFLQIIADNTGLGRTAVNLSYTASHGSCYKPIKINTIFDTLNDTFYIIRDNENLRNEGR